MGASVRTFVKYKQNLKPIYGSRTKFSSLIENFLRNILVYMHFFDSIIGCGVTSQNI